MIGRRLVIQGGIPTFVSRRFLAYEKKGAERIKLVFQPRSIRGATCRGRAAPAWQV